MKDLASLQKREQIQWIEVEGSRSLSQQVGRNLNSWSWDNVTAVGFMPQTMTFVLWSSIDQWVKRYFWRKPLQKSSFLKEYVQEEVGIPAGTPLFQVCRCDGGERRWRFCFLGWWWGREASRSFDKQGKGKENVKTNAKQSILGIIDSRWLGEA